MNGLTSGKNGIQHEKISWNGSFQGASPAKPADKFQVRPYITIESADAMEMRGALACASV
jgi:hypothetical protein